MDKLETITCGLCEKQFTQKKNLYVHIRNVHKIEPLGPNSLQPSFQCRMCNKKFLYRSSLNRHMKCCHACPSKADYDNLLTSVKGIRLICPQEDCGAKFPKYINLRQHLMEQHDVNVESEDWTFYCPGHFERWKEQMQRETQALYTLDTGVRPLLNGASKKVYNCHRSYSYKNKSKKRRTLSPITNKIGRACPARIEVTFENDEQSTISVKFWKTHCGHTETLGRMTYNELSDGRIECKVCKTIFFMKHHFETHVCTAAKIKEVKKIPCPQCWKTFSSNFNLRRHSHLHSTEKPCECDTCKKRFPHKENLNRHLLTHATETPHKCELCKKFFSQRDALEEHMNKHSRLTRFACEQCGKCFTRKHSVFVHVRCVHKDDKCNKQLKNKSDCELEKHMNAETKIECEDHIEVTETKVCYQEIERKAQTFIKVKEETSVELAETFVPKPEPKDEYFEFSENSIESFTDEKFDEDTKCYLLLLEKDA